MEHFLDILYFDEAKMSRLIIMYSKNEKSTVN